MFEGNDSRGTLQELGLRMEEKTANRVRNVRAGSRLFLIASKADPQAAAQDLLRLDRVFEVEQRWMRELSRRSSQAPARQ